MLRAREPDETGFVERDGVRTYWERFGDGDQTLLLLPTWSLFHSRHWKFQLPYFARHFRVLTFDGRGNGKSDRPLDPASYSTETFAADALAVLDATETDRTAVVGFSAGGPRALMLAANDPDRVSAAVFIGPAVALGETLPHRVRYSWDERLDTTEGWAKYNRHYWLADYRGF